MTTTLSGNSTIATGRILSANRRRSPGPTRPRNTIAPAKTIPRLSTNFLVHRRLDSAIRGRRGLANSWAGSTVCPPRRRKTERCVCPLRHKRADNRALRQGRWPQRHRPGKEEQQFHIEYQKCDGHQVKANREAAAGVMDRIHAAFVGHPLHPRGPAGVEKSRNPQQCETHADDDGHQERPGESSSARLRPLAAVNSVNSVNCGIVLAGPKRGQAQWR